MQKVVSKTIDVQKAQVAYNDAVTKYCAESSQAQTKMLSLQKVGNALTAAQEELTKVQQGTIETISTGQSAFVDEYGNMKSLGEIMGFCGKTSARSMLTSWTARANCVNMTILSQSWNQNVMPQ